MQHDFHNAFQSHYKLREYVTFADKVEQRYRLCIQSLKGPASIHVHCRLESEVLNYTSMRHLVATIAGMSRL